MLEHGGKVRRAAQEFDIPLQDWLDLSTGLNPQSWPLPTIAKDAWTRLPEEEDELNEAAKNYYGTQCVLPVAGSQAAIQALPRLYAQLRKNSRIGILDPTYAEHAHAWRTSGFEVTTLAASEIDDNIETLDVLIIVNPNNPSGEVFTSKQLLAWHQSLLARDGWLIIDEAFMDPTPKNSLAQHAHKNGLIILRSLGKFFGLAGARVGFVLAAPALLDQLAETLGPWNISGPARVVAQAALQDTSWQQKTRQRLIKDEKRLTQLLTNNGLTPSGGTALFQWLKTPQARKFHLQLARQGILTRLFQEPSSIRFGLPGDEQQWRRLEQGLNNIHSIQPDQNYLQETLVR